MTDNDNNPPSGMPPKGESETAWEDQGSPLKRLRSTPTGDGSSGDGARVERTEEQLRAGGEPSIRSTAGETPETAAAAASARERAQHLGRRLQGRAGDEVRQQIERAELANVGLAEPEGVPAVIVEEPLGTQLSEEQERRAERQVSLAFILSALATIAFLAIYIVVPLHQSWGRPSNVLLGLTLGIALFGIGAGLVLWQKKIMPHEEGVQSREELHPTAEESEALAEEFKVGAEESGFMRRKVLRRSLLASTGLLALPPLFLLRDLGPSPTGDNGKSLLSQTAWRRDMRLVDLDSGEPIKVGDIEVGGLKTAVPEGHKEAEADSSLMLIRLHPDFAQQNAFKEDEFVDGYIAYSKICTHAGCPVSLYEQQFHHFLCPCHMSTFDATDRGKVIFGPAARALPILPIYIDSDGYFRAVSDFREPIGPSFWERT